MEPTGDHRGRSERLEPDLVGSTRGAVSTEYVVLLAMVGMAAAAGIIGLGGPLVSSYSQTRNKIVSPTP